MENSQLYVLKENMVIHTYCGCDVDLMSELMRGFLYGDAKFEIRNDCKEYLIAIGNMPSRYNVEGEFLLNICEEGVTLTGENFAAMMRGFMTFLQKITYHADTDSFCVPCGVTKGVPDIEFRSVHLCVFPETKLSFLQKCIRTCGVLKYTHIIMEFWGMLQFDCMKELGWQHAYTKKEVAPLIHEANAMGMEVIPMFNHLGHASASRVAYGKHVVLDQNPALAKLFCSEGWEWDFTNPRVREILHDVRTELIELCGPGKYFHLGCDEAYSFLISGKWHMAEKFAEFINEIQEELQLSGRRAIIWGDMLLPKEIFADDKYEFFMAGDMAEGLCENLNRNIIVADWQYDVKQIPWKSAFMFREKGFDVICCPWKDGTSAVGTVTEERMFGIMQTTWHTLGREFPMMVELGLRAYDHHDADRLLGNKALRRLYAAELQRKVLFVNGAYEEAGWNERQMEM